MNTSFLPLGQRVAPFMRGSGWAALATSPRSLDDLRSHQNRKCRCQVYIQTKIQRKRPWKQIRLALSEAKCQLVASKFWDHFKGFIVNQDQLCENEFSCEKSNDHKCVGLPLDSQVKCYMIYVSILMQIPHCLFYYSSIVNFEIRKCESSNIVLFFSRLFGLF